jgi:pSer/pThr/pTyr-binding forkhead associated (FHA) protein
VIGPAAPPDDEDAIAGSADDFVMAGAQAFPRIEVYQGQAVRGRYEVRGDVFVIGRLSRQLGGVPDLDFSSYADGKQVSRHHARIVQDSGAYYVEDLESAAGTWLNGELLVPNRPYPLRDDDEINIGEVATLVFLLP